VRAAAHVKSSFVFEFGEEFYRSVLRLAVLCHVNQIEKFFDADENSEKEFFLKLI
jgi:hypothetical protein